LRLPVAILRPIESRPPARCRSDGSQIFRRCISDTNQPLPLEMARRAGDLSVGGIVVDAVRDDHLVEEGEFAGVDGFGELAECRRCGLSAHARLSLSCNTTSQVWGEVANSVTVKFSARQARYAYAREKCLATRFRIIRHCAPLCPPSFPALNAGKELVGPL